MKILIFDWPKKLFCFSNSLIKTLLTTRKWRDNVIVRNKIDRPIETFVIQFYYGCKVPTWRIFRCPVPKRPIMYSMTRPHVRKVLGSFRYRSSAHFLCGVPVRILQIRKFLMINLSIAISKFILCASSLIAYFQIFHQNSEDETPILKNFRSANNLVRRSKIRNMQKWLGLQIANPKIATFAEGPLV